MGKPTIYAKCLRKTAELYVNGLSHTYPVIVLREDCLTQVMSFKVAHGVSS